MPFVIRREGEGTREGGLGVGEWDREGVREAHIGDLFKLLSICTCK